MPSPSFSIRPGRPPTKNPDEIVAWYGARKRPIPPGVLEKARSAASTLPSVRNVPARIVTTAPALPTAPVKQDDPNETEAQIIHRVGKVFTLISDFTDLALDGDLSSMVISGGPGTGKSHNVKQKLYAAREKDNSKVEIIAGGNITPINLFMAMWRMKEAGRVLLLDDADAVWWDEDSLAVLKGGLDSVPDRQISWMSNSRSLEENAIPKTFMFRGAIIFISNYDFQTYIDTSKTKITEHMRAVMNRTNYIAVPLHTLRENLVWLKHTVMTNHVLVQKGLTRDQESDVVDYIEKNVGILRSVSIRTACNCVPFVKKYGKDWREWATMTQRR